MPFDPHITRFLLAHIPERDIALLEDGDSSTGSVQSPEELARKHNPVPDTSGRLWNARESDVSKSGFLLTGSGLVLAHQALAEPGLVDAPVPVTSHCIPTAQPLWRHPFGKAGASSLNHALRLKI